MQETHGSPISSHPVTQFQSGWSGSMRVCPTGRPGGNEVMVAVWVEKMKKTMLFCLCPWPILQLELRFYCWEWLHWDTFWSFLWTPTLPEVWCSYKSSYTHVLFKTPLGPVSALPVQHPNDELGQQGQQGEQNKWGQRVWSGTSENKFDYGKESFQILQTEFLTPSEDM